MFNLAGVLGYTANMQLAEQMRDFQERVWVHYAAHGRQMPWRDTPTPYNVVISEVMLQQTQVDRVRQKYVEWIARWDDFELLSQASTAEVVTAWQGLGYNRRALWIKELADRVSSEYSGALPASQSELTQFRGIGQNTAGAILAYAFNQPVVFIETNIRRVFIHEFFPDEEGVSDADILPLVERAVDVEHPREWYWALMDYGAMLSREVVNPNRRSRHYTKQSTFEGSYRQLRGAIVAALAAQPSLDIHILEGLLGRSRSELERAIEGLAADGFLSREGKRITIKT